MNLAWLIAPLLVMSGAYSVFYPEVVASVNARFLKTLGMPEPFGSLTCHRRLTKAAGISGLVAGVCLLVALMLE
ncbi:MAG: hypothetical protein AAGF31_11765 [Planctomycetota bacterium]